MKIVLLVPGGVDRSGQERVIPALLWLIEGLARRHQVLVIALRQELEPNTYPLLGATVANLGCGRGHLPGLGSLQCLARLRRVLANHGRGYDVVHGFWLGDVGFLAGVAGLFLRAPVVVTAWGGGPISLPQIEYGGQRLLRSRFRVGLSLRLARVVTVGSRYQKGLLGSSAPGAVWLPLGVDTSLFDAPVNRPKGPPWRLLQVASLNRVKDPTTMLQALRLVLAQNPQVHLDWVGEDTLNGSIQQQAAALGVAGRITFHGFLPINRVAPLYQQAHLYVQSSLHEGQGVAVCEAAAAGLPAVGTKVGLVAELAPERAVAVPVANARALADEILSLLADRQRRERLGLAAQAWACEHDAIWTAAQFEAIYEKLLDKRGRRQSRQGDVGNG